MEHQYVIVSPRLGTPGEPWTPPVYVNLHALLDAGFIRRATDATPAPAPAAKGKVKRNTAPDTDPPEA